ncbi:Protein CBG15389 [Caenorhabditis briggsae]|uniref:Signal peptidase complex catalytic subunit SEC11 n=2 Tax=Eukaryota TaxID=2759 RepID=H8WGZ5_CAEBR|nr:Protein CBG15389 [Caenorhabditis briggsae]CCG58587.1 Protein CBG15389 [Caenorhabditis briggsae]
MTSIGSKSRSNKDKSVDSEKSEARTTTMESWADAMQNQVTLRERKKLVKGYADFIGTSETVVESVREQLGVHSKCSERQKDVIVKPMKEFVSELTKRYNELGSGKWERVVMRIMRQNGLEKLEDLRDAVLPDDLTASARNTETKVFHNQLKLLQDGWRKEKEELEEELSKSKRENDEVVEKLEEAWKDAEKAEETIEELERALLKERKTSEKWRNQLEHDEGKKKEKFSGNKEKTQVHARKSPSRSFNGSSVDWHNERKERKTGESFYKKGDLKNERSEDWRVKVKNWEVNSSEGDFPERSVRVSERRKCERDSERCSRVSRDSSRMVVECLSRIMRASALPEPEKFDGKGDVKEFKRSFLLKYKSVTERDADMVATLEDKFLKDAARTLFKTLPNRFNRSIESLFEEFEEKLRKRRGDREAEALNEFEELKRKPKQPMWEYLMDVEKWSKRAFPHLEEETMSQLRVTKLMRALRDDPTMQKLMTMKRYEVAKKYQYEFLKDIVLQQENEDKRRQGLGKSYRHEKKEMSWKKEDSKVAKQDNAKAEIKCYRCQESGHIARDCEAKVIHHVETDGTGRGVGAKMREQIQLLGQKRLMFIDSGAEVSVMLTKVWEALKKGCVRWRQRVEVLTNPTFALRNVSGKNMPVKGQLKIPIMMRGNKANVWFQLVEDKAEILLFGTNAFESIGVELAWKPKQEERVKKEGKGPKAKWERNAERAKCETSSATVNHIMTEGNVVENNHFCRKLMEEGGGCKKGKCTVQEGYNVCSSVQQLGVVLSAKGKGVDLEKWNLLKYSKEFQAQVTTVEKEEALQKFAKECPQVAEAIRKEGAYAEWEEAAVKIRLALKSEIKPRTTIIKEPALIVSPRLKISGRRNILEVRNSHGSDFMEKYEWKKVKNVLWLCIVTKDKEVNQRIFEMIKKLAEEVPEVIMVPFKLECVMKEVDKVTEEWRKRLKTLNNVKLIDPRKEVGKRELPLIVTSSDKYESGKSLLRYLEQEAEDNPCVKRLKAMSAEKEEPHESLSQYLNIQRVATHEHPRDDPIRVGDITVFNIEGRPIPIVHRVIKVHEKSANDTKFLTKGDNNNVHDRSLYAEKQQWLKRSDVIGRVKGLIPYCGYMTILVNEVPYFKHILIGFMAIVTLLHREY